MCCCALVCAGASEKNPFARHSPPLTASFSSSANSCTFSTAVGPQSCRHLALTSPLGLGRTLNRVLLPVVLVDNEDVLSTKEKAMAGWIKASEARVARRDDTSELCAAGFSRARRRTGSCEWYRGRYQSLMSALNTWGQLLPRSCALGLGTHVVKDVSHDHARAVIRSFDRAFAVCKTHSLAEDELARNWVVEGPRTDLDCGDVLQRDERFSAGAIVRRGRRLCGAHFSPLRWDFLLAVIDAGESDFAGRVALRAGEAVEVLGGEPSSVVVAPDGASIEVDCAAYRGCAGVYAVLYEFCEDARERRNDGGRADELGRGRSEAGDPTRTEGRRMLLQQRGSHTRPPCASIGDRVTCESGAQENRVYAEAAKRKAHLSLESLLHSRIRKQAGRRDSQVPAQNTPGSIELMAPPKLLVDDNSSSSSSSESISPASAARSRRFSASRASSIASR